MTTTTIQYAVWNEYPRPDATTDRGWLKALCAPYSRDRYPEYTQNTMPMYDDTVPGNWRESSTLGNYLDYGPCRPRATGPQVHCICYATGNTAYVSTPADARAWIEAEARSARPLLRVRK